MKHIPLIYILKKNKMNKIINERIKSMRKFMAETKIDAFIIPSSDPHLSEYPADCWKFREYLSGFTGSAGTLLITKNKAALWTDSRYFLQAEEQLADTEIELLKEGLPGTTDIITYIIKENTNVLGFDGSLFSVENADYFLSYMDNFDIKVKTNVIPYNKVWKSRPEIPMKPFYIFDEKYCGKSTIQKLRELRERMKNEGINGIPITSLDDIAWLYNIRCNDIKFNPVGIAYAYVTKRNAYLFTYEKKLPENIKIELDKSGITIKMYSEFYSFVKKEGQGNILIDPANTNFKLYKSIKGSIIEEECPLKLMKAVKNDTEIKGFKESVIKDSVALTRFWIWLEKEAASGNNNEYAVGEKIAEFRKEQDNYVEESFNPIVGFNENGAIVHYTASKGESKQIKGKGSLLIDTGGQYMSGTTDITRTFFFNGPTDKDFKRDYTLVLKGAIALASVKFPKGTTGSQLEIMAKQHLWHEHKTFMHGTGHGIGHFLNVHEGPQGFSPSADETELEPGMVTSDEPGIYIKGKYGIRLENMILCVKEDETEFGEFLGFKVLTLLPFDTKCINTNMLTQEETKWLNEYHKNVYNKTAPFLTKEEKDWLKYKTKEI